MTRFDGVSKYFPGKNGGSAIKDGVSWGGYHVRVVVFTIFFLFLTSDALYSATYQVGPARTYTNLQDVAGFLLPGDIVEVDGNNTYAGGVTFTRPGSTADPITIRGMPVGGNRPVLSGGINTVHFMTDSPYSGPGADHYVLEGFEVTGGSSRCIFHQANDLTIRDTVVRDCPAQGILGADQGSGSLTMQYVEVYNCGSETYQHQIYMATDEVHYPGSVFRMENCYVHDGNGGNNVKTRAERNEIYYNWIEGGYYHELEMIGPDGGDAATPLWHVKTPMSWEMFSEKPAPTVIFSSFEWAGMEPVKPTVGIVLSTTPSLPTRLRSSGSSME